MAPARGRGYVVVEFTSEQLLQVYAVRAVLEGLAARIAARTRTNADLGRLGRLT